VDLIGIEPMISSRPCRQRRATNWNRTAAAA